MRKIKDFDYAVSKSGRVYSFKAGRFLKPSVGRKGYMRVTLYNNNVQETHLVHRLVAIYWIPNPEDKPTVNHIDGDKSNNSVENLEWATYSENNTHALETRLKINTGKVLDDTTAHTLFKMVMGGTRKKDIIQILGITEGQYRWFVYSDTYKHIRDEYDWENRPLKSASISDEAVIKICSLLEDKVTVKEISRETGVDTKKIRNIKNRITYRHFSESFVF
jgi:hypothetical protein